MPLTSETLLCNEDTFNCTYGVPSCIPMSWVCDGHKECSDGSDESQTICSKLCQFYSIFLHIKKVLPAPLAKIILQKTGHARKDCLHVMTVFHDAFRQHKNATDTKIVLMEVMRLAAYAVSEILTVSKLSNANKVNILFNFRLLQSCSCPIQQQ